MERSQINLGYVGSFEVTQELFALSKSGISVDSPNGGGFDNEKISYNHSQDVLGLYLGAKKIAGVKDLSPDFERFFMKKHLKMMSFCNFLHHIH